MGGPTAQLGDQEAYGQLPVTWLVGDQFSVHYIFRGTKLIEDGLYNVTLEWSHRCRKWLATAKHEGNHAKAPMQPIIATAPLELLHVDFTSIATTMELDWPPNVVSV